MTASPTIEPNQTPYFLIILFYSLFILFLLTCGATVYKAGNRRSRFQLRLKQLAEEVDKYENDINTDNEKYKTEAEKKAAKDKKKAELKEQLQTLYQRDLYADIGDHFIAPITESGVSKTMSKLMFHTSLGRVLVNLESKLEGSLLAILQYMLSLQGVEVFRYYATLSGFPQQTMLAQFFGLWVAYVLFMLLNLMKEEFVRSRMGGDMSIIEKED